MLNGGALIFVQCAFYPGQPHTLWQEIGVRLSLTGLLASAAAGYADVLGYGSNPPGAGQHPALGIYQTMGMVGGFLIAALGVLIFALSGSQEIVPLPPAESDEPAQQPPQGQNVEASDVLESGDLIEPESAKAFPASAASAVLPALDLADSEADSHSALAEPAAQPPAIDRSEPSAHSTSDASSV